MKYIIFILLSVLSLHGYCQMFEKSDSTDASNNKYTLFKSKKLHVTYIFKEMRSDISLGCEIQKTENGKTTKLKNLDVAAYTKDASGRMNYNSIIPYISIISAGNRIVISFECDLLVFNPDRMSEKIERSKNIYGLMGPEGIEIKSY